MSSAEISNAQLDWLLGQASPPPQPAAGLVDRIVARSIASPQARARLLAIPRRHASRRRPTLWGLVIGANLMAAAAAATSWDGQRFDFQRLLELPHKVAAAIHVEHPRKKSHKLLQRQRIGRVEHAAPAAAPAAPPRIETMASRSGPGLHEKPAMVRGAPHQFPRIRGIARAARLHPQMASGPPFRSVRVAVRGPTGFHPRSTKGWKTDRAASGPVQSHEVAVAQAAPRLEERRERRAALAERQQAPTEVRAPSEIQKSVSRPPAEAPVMEAQQPELNRARGRRWQNRLFNRPRFRQRGNRFRRRF